MSKLLVTTLSLVFVLGCTTATTKPSSEAATEDSMEGCHTPLGFIREGRSMTGYLRPVEQGGANCQQGELTCVNGVWTGAYIHPSCTRLPN